MAWNWQLEAWPNFQYDPVGLQALEAQFLHGSGVLVGAFKHLDEDDKRQLTVEIISDEAVKTSEIEGEYLNRDSVQSSVQRQFGLDADVRQATPAEQGTAEMMVDLYRFFQATLDEERLFLWHEMLMRGRHDVRQIGAYRTHPEPMQVISATRFESIVHFEAPPSEHVPAEMKRFIDWYDSTAPDKPASLPSLLRAGIAHLYFVAIHPFEDGNGRIARAIAEKALAESLGQPSLIALAHIIEKERGDYYRALAAANRTVEITDWLIYFAQTILAAQAYTGEWITFLIAKTRLYDKLRGQLNQRQDKALALMFREGPEGFDGGLSAGNYIRLTRSSRATATRDLQDLVAKGALVRTGERRNARYHLNLNR